MRGSAFFTAVDDFVVLRKKTRNTYSTVLENVTNTVVYCSVPARAEYTVYFFKDATTFRSQPRK